MQWCKGLPFIDNDGLFDQTLQIVIQQINNCEDLTKLAADYDGFLLINLYPIASIEVSHLFLQVRQKTVEKTLSEVK